MARVSERPSVWRLPGPGPDPVAVLRAVGSGRGRFWLDDAVAGVGVLGWDPGPALRTLDELPAPGGRRLPEGARFAGGWVGWLGYEAGRRWEAQPDPCGPTPLPDLGLRRYDGGLSYGPEGWVAAGSAAFVRDARAVLRRAGPAEARAPVSARLVDPGAPDAFLRGVAAVLDHIAAGDCYQVNLARRLVLELSGEGLDAYRQLRAVSPARFGAWIEHEAGQVLSNSPELFLEVVGREVRSQPIKGTCGLGRSVRERLRLAQALLDSDKECAELTMIVDLVRNDLGRVCEPGSIGASPRAVRVLPTLQHAEQTVSGRLRTGLGAAELVRAAFPPGSVTGAPKVAAMAHIRALEAHPRGVYTGAIGYVDDSGDARLSVAIRTATLVQRRAELHVGCGLVADSDPEAELAESELKAAAFLGAWTGTAPLPWSEEAAC